MKYSLFCISLLSSFITNAQQITVADKASIYNTIISTYGQKGTNWVNETIASIYPYDIDSSYAKRYSKSLISDIADTSSVSIVLICTEPVRYESYILSYFQYNNLEVDSSTLFSQLQNFSLDSLNNYVAPAKFISYKQAPLLKSGLSNFFRKSTATALSPILFDSTNQLAFVKMQTYSKKGQMRNNPSKIIILKRADEWKVIKTLGMKY